MVHAVSRIVITTVMTTGITTMAVITSIIHGTNDLTGYVSGGSSYHTAELTLSLSG